MKDEEKMTPDFLELTEDELELVQKKIKSGYDVELSLKDAARFALLAKELEWWHGLHNDADSMDQITAELKTSREDLYKKVDGHEMPKSEVAKSTKTIVETVTKKEEKRVQAEMTAIIKSYKK